MNNFFALRNDPYFRLPTFQPGDKVRVVCVGPSFSNEMKKRIGDYFIVERTHGAYVSLHGDDGYCYWNATSLMLCERNGVAINDIEDHRNYMHKATLSTKNPDDAVLLRTRRLNSDETLDEYCDTYFHCLKHWLDYSRHEGWMMDRDGTYYYIVETLPLLNSGVIAPMVYTMNFRASDSMKRAVQQASQLPETKKKEFEVANVGDSIKIVKPSIYPDKAALVGKILSVTKRKGNDIEAGGHYWSSIYAQYEIVLHANFESDVKQAVHEAEKVLDQTDRIIAGHPGTLVTFDAFVERTPTKEGDCSMGLPRIPKIESTTLIDDMPIACLNDDTLLEQIRNLEAAKESLQKYQGKVPLIVTKKIEDIDEAVAKITELLDERFVAKNPPAAMPAASTV